MTGGRWRAGIDGGYTVDFITFGVDSDGTEVVNGLPDDKCQCPHWGYVFRGKLIFRTDDGEEVFGPGDTFYLPPSHVPVVAAGSEYLQFSPSGLPSRRRVVTSWRVRRAGNWMRSGPGSGTPRSASGRPAS